MCMNQRHACTVQQWQCPSLVHPAPGQSQTTECLSSVQLDPHQSVPCMCKF
jgi:hypothetical protein